MKRIFACLLLCAAIFAASCSNDKDGEGKVRVTGVSLDRPTLVLQPGEAGTLTATVMPLKAEDQRVSWKSDNESVVTVDGSGQVSSVGLGETTITVTTLDGGFTDVCIVSVVEQIVPVTGVAVSVPVLSVLVGESQLLSATITPAEATDKGVVWSSDKTSVATVDKNGLVTGVSLGEAKITVATVDGGFTATCVVTVANKTIPVTDVVLSQNTATLNPGETVALTATVTPSNATDKSVAWSTNNPSVATVTDGVVMAVAAGQALITATTTNGALTATCTVSVNSADVGDLAGEWKLSTWAESSAMEGKIWLKFNADLSFELYQSIGNLGFDKFTGTYVYNTDTESLSGVYSDGKAWKRSYQVQSLTSEQLTLVDASAASDISVYLRLAIPDYVKDGVTGKSVRADVERFL